MKKFICLLTLIVSTFYQSQAQEKSPQDYSLSADQSYLPFPGTSTDVIGTGGDSIWFYTVKRVVPDKQAPYIYLKLNRVNTTGTVAISLYGKQTYNSPDTLIAPVITWNKTTADTLIKIVPSTYRTLDYTKLYIKGSTSAAGGKVIFADFKFVQE